MSLPRIFIIGAVVTTVALACSSAEVALERSLPDAGAPTSPGFGAEGGIGELTPSIEGDNLCATNECPAGRVTCPNHPFPCAVDLSSDNDNCGACGVHCPNDDAFAAKFHGIMKCVKGVCELMCDPKYDNCNGIKEDGCEIQIDSYIKGDINNCGGCGIRCEDEDICINGSCGCPNGYTLCDDGKCHNLYAENENCGACGNVCPPPNPITHPPFPPELHKIYACKGGQCNIATCAPGWVDCNGDFYDPDGDGCEANTGDDPNNCGGCGRQCRPEEICYNGMCFCPCGGPCDEDINSTIDNCGSCGNICPGDRRSLDSAWSELDPAHGRPTCEHGVCGYACTSGWGNCDNDIDNGCETDLRNDPMNCGACGVRCDGVAGQPCINGRCAMKKCETVQ